MQNFNKRLKQSKADAERLRKMKIEIQYNKRNKATQKVQKKKDLLEQKAFKLGYKARVRELLKKNEVRST